MRLKQSISKYLKKGTAALAVVLAAAMIVPAMPVRQAAAATTAETAEKKLLAKAEKLAVAYAEAGFSYDYNYGLNDINGDGIPELFCSYTGDENDPGAITAETGLKIYGYNGKVKLLKTFSNVNSVKLFDNKVGVEYTVMEAGEDDGFAWAAEYRYETYSMTKSGKLKLKTSYKAVNKDEEEGGGYFKNDKKISEEKYWDYTTDFDYYPDAQIWDTSEKARGITKFNGQVQSCKLLLAFRSYQWMLFNQAESDKTRYIATLEKYGDTGDKANKAEIIINKSELENVDIFGFGDGDEELPEKKLGKFDLSSLGLLDTEEIVSVETVDRSEKYSSYSKVTFKTVLRPSSVSEVFPGFEYPGDRDVQGYNLLGTYTYESSTETLTAEFAYSQKALEGEHATGLLIPLCVYTIRAE